MHPSELAILTSTLIARSNDTITPLEIADSPYVQKVKALAAPWVIGCSLQCVFTGIILYQAQRFSSKAQRKHLSVQLQAFIGLLLFVNFAASVLEMRILWWFAMAISGSKRKQDWPVTLSAELVVNPFAVMVCQSAHAALAHKAASRKSLYLWVVLPILLACFAASIGLGVCNVLIYRIPSSAPFYTELSYYFGYPFAAILLVVWTGNTVLRAHRASHNGVFDLQRSGLSDILGHLLSTGVIAIIPLIGVAVTVYARLFPTTPAIVFHTVTPRVLAMSILASLSETIPSTSNTTDTGEKRDTTLPENRILGVHRGSGSHTESTSASSEDLEKSGSTSDSGCEITLVEMMIGSKLGGKDAEPSYEGPASSEQDITLAGTAL